MPTLVDALYVELGLNPAPFEKGSKAALVAFTKTKEAAQTAGKTIEESSQKAATSISNITKEVLTLFAVFLGARGIKEFISDVVSADAALGRFSANLGTSPQTIAAWGDAAERVGGTAEATSATFEKLGKALNDFRFNGKALPDDFFKLESLAHMRIDTNDGIPRFLSDTAAALKKVYDSNPARAHFLAEGMGIDEGTANLMFQQGAAINAYVASLTNLTATGPQLKAAQDLQLAWVTLRQNAESLANELVRDLEPAIQPILSSMTAWLQSNHDIIDSKIKEYVGDFTAYLKDPATWSSVKEGMSNFASAAQAVAQAIDDIVKGIKYLAQLNEDSKSWGIMKILNGGQSLSGQGGVNDSFLHPQTRPGSIGESIVNWLTGGKSASTGAGAHAGTTVDGRPVSKANPMPVTPVDTGNGGGALDFLFGGGRYGTGGGMGSGGGGLPRHPGSSSGIDVGSYSGTTGGKVSGDMKERGLELMNFLVHEKGWTPAAAAIAAGNAQQESGIRSDGPMGDPGTPGGSWGMFQWNRERLARLKAFGGANWRDKNVQREFFAREAEKMVPNWKSQPDLSKAGQIGKSYEGYGDNSTGTRVSNAAAFLKAYQDSQNSVAAHSYNARTPSGARGAAALSTVQNNNRVTTSSTANEHNIGTINIHTQATDPNGIASGISSAIKRNTTTSTANTGPQ